MSSKFMFACLSGYLVRFSQENGLTEVSETVYFSYVEAPSRDKLTNVPRVDINYFALQVSDYYFSLN